jgi:membrane dipeptidase
MSYYTWHRTVVAEHAVRPRRRPETDDRIRAVAGNGGMIGLNSFPAFISAEGQPTLDELLADSVWRVNTYPPPPWRYPKAWRTPSPSAGPPNDSSNGATPTTRSRGVLGENWMRVLDRFWSKAN